MFTHIAVPIKVHVPGHANITRIATGYTGDYVAIEIDGHTQAIPKDKVSPEAHKAINIALRKRRKYNSTAES